MTTELKINLSPEDVGRVTIGDLPDGTFFLYDGDVYVKNKFKGADAFGINGRTVLTSGAYDDEYPTKVFSKVEVTLI